MEQYYLTIRPYQKNSFRIPLYDDADAIQRKNVESGAVFTDLTHSFEIECKNRENIGKFSLYVNGELKHNYKTERIFTDCFGLAELEFVIEFNDGTPEKKLYSKPLTVFVKNEEFNKNVRAMVKYIFDHCEMFLVSGKAVSKNLSDLKESRYKSLQSQMELAEQTALMYSENYAYFKANCKCKVEKIPVIENIDKIQHISPETFRYTVTHPEHMERTKNPAGLRIGKNFFQPVKTLALKNNPSRDIYENRVILLFLRKILNDVSTMYDRCKNILSEHKKIQTGFQIDDYINSAEFLFAENKKNLESALSRLAELKKIFFRLLAMYKNIFDLPVIENFKFPAPRPTMIFMSVPSYKKIFICIQQWLKFGIYDFMREEYLLSFDGISGLYEKYLLAKMLTRFENAGRIISERKQIIYPLHKNALHKQQNMVNKFTFAGDKKISLYYQPVIYNGEKYDENKTFDMPKLYRNNSVPSDSTGAGGTYYVPDFVVEKETGEHHSYVIIDAKFKKEENVYRYDVKDLAFKYIVSISAVNELDDIESLFVIYGKCDVRSRLKNIYDKEKKTGAIKPSFKSVPIMEGILPGSHYTYLDEIFR